MPPHPYDDPAAPSSAPNMQSERPSAFSVGPGDRPFYGPHRGNDAEAYDPYPPRHTWMRPVGFGAVALLAAIGLWFAYAKSKDPALAAQPGGALPLLKAEAGATKMKATAQNQATEDQDSDVYNINKVQPKVEKLLPPPEQPMQKPSPPPVQLAATTPVLPGNSAVPTPLEPQAVGEKPLPKSVPLASPGPSQQAAPATGTLVTPDVPTGMSAPVSSGSKVISVPPPGGGGGSVGGVGKIIQVGPQAQVSPPMTATKPLPIPPTTPPVSATVSAAAAQVAGLKVQIGATKDEASARKEFERLQRAHPTLLGGLSATVMRADLGEKGVFYRIQAGPIADKGKADQLCSDLKNVSIGCIVVK